jgi:hypothetical protein
MVAIDNFNMFDWSDTIPLADELWLGMQFRNLAIIDQTFLRPLENDALRECLQRERTPTEFVMPLSALSQMWVFAVYEVLRTWRQRARELKEAHEQYLAIDFSDQEKWLKERVAKAKSKEVMAVNSIPFYSQKFERLSEPNFISDVSNYMDETEGLFRIAESLRVHLAKHEIPKTSQMVAHNPGYGRLNMTTGSMYWPVVLKDGEMMMIDRQKISNALFKIDEFEDFDSDY